jgi:NAD(P)-dependent dehydrogenase (short-subunit alcohol dehydrogenase family)
MTVAIVTGGSRGIGAAVAEHLGREGMAVACTATSLDSAAAVARAVRRRYGVPTLPVELRIEDADGVRQAFAHVEATLGPIGLLVNNAGVTNVAPIVEADLDELSHLVDVNLKGALYCSQAAARLMIASGTSGSIINLGSVGGFNGFPGRGAYGATKAAIHHLTKVLAIELARHRIRVNCVAPGFVETDMVKKLAADGVLDVDALRRRTPLGELIPAAEIAETISWLASPAARHVTGESLLVDGGWTAYGHL